MKIMQVSPELLMVSQGNATCHDDFALTIYPPHAKLRPLTLALSRESADY
jgi:hypothetical protein